MKHLDIRVTGKVQGVFFRAHAQEKANDLKLKGNVRNQPDGSVYIECEGEDDKLQKFLEWCHRGPEKARVDKVEVTEGKLKHFDQFELIRD